MRRRRRRKRRRRRRTNTTMLLMILMMTTMMILTTTALTAAAAAATTTTSTAATATTTTTATAAAVATTTTTTSHFNVHFRPQVVHYVWFSNHSLDVVTMLSVLAAYRFVDPCLILFHADSLPQGPNWTALLSLVPVVVVVRRTAPSTVFGRTLGAVQHKSDIARLEALKGDALMYGVSLASKEAFMK